MAISQDNILFRTTVLGHVFPDDEIDIFVTSSMGWFDGIPGVDVDAEDEFGTINNHVQRAQNLLIEHFEDSTNLNRLLAIYTEELQEIEYVLRDILNSRNLEIAAGAQLDIIGERVGESRNYSDDEEYRAAIYFRIFLNKSNGEPETLIEALTVLGSALSIRYYEPSPATVYLVFTAAEMPPSNLLSRMELIAAAGVKIILGLAITEDNLFGFGDEGGVSAPITTEGFNEEGYTQGGHFIETLN